IPWETSYNVNAADPILHGDKVFVSSGYDRGCAAFRVNSSKPAVLWENKNMRNHFNSCVLLNGCVYGIDGNASASDAALKCIDLADGKVKWTFPGVGTGGVTIADGKLIVISARGELMVGEASPSGFKPVSRAQVLGGKCWITPVLANGRIFCRNAAG